MKRSFKLLFTIGALSMFLLTNCRTGDDGTENHGSAVDGVGKKKKYNNQENPSDATSGQMEDTTGYNDPLLN